jgi:hypothetical protein
VCALDTRASDLVECLLFFVVFFPRQTDVLAMLRDANLHVKELVSALTRAYQAAAPHRTWTCTTRRAIVGQHV